MDHDRAGRYAEAMRELKAATDPTIGIGIARPRLSQRALASADACGTLAWRSAPTLTKTSMLRPWEP